MAHGDNAPVLRDAVAVAHFYAVNLAVAAPSLARIVADGKAETAWPSHFAA